VSFNFWEDRYPLREKASVFSLFRAMSALSLQFVALPRAVGYNAGIEKCLRLIAF
jgi:hypothetical protein